jgi:hypothetical protein
MTSAGQTLTNVNTLIQEITSLKSSITTSFNRLKKENPSLEFEREIRDLKEEEKKYDKEFVNEHTLYGGKTRKQTLQEFILLFFYVSLGVFFVSLAMITYVKTPENSLKESLKVFGAGVLIVILLTAILIRYA